MTQPRGVNPLPPISLDDALLIMQGDWSQESLCIGAPPDLFFPPDERKGEASKLYDQARTICSTCPVKDSCLRYALLTHQEHGMWGGMTPRQRKVVDNHQRCATCITCGNPFTYVQHAARRQSCGRCQVRPERRTESRHAIEETV